MKSVFISAITLAIIIFAACSASKKTAKTPPTAAPAPLATKTDIPKPKSYNGVYAPGIEEITAIQTMYKDVTMKTLNDGYTIYTGVCKNCHETKSIYSRSEAAWPGIINDMAVKARLDPQQKDAVYKYVMAIKATQPEDMKPMQNNN